MATATIERKLAAADDLGEFASGGSDMYCRKRDRRGKTFSKITTKYSRA
jgi:hypothetical protein